MKRSALKSWLQKPFTAIAAVGLIIGLSFATHELSVAAEGDQPVYDVEEARSTPLVNPHQQIDDEGRIIWESCLSCHTNLPDIKTEKSIKDVSLRHSDDLDMLCRTCHVVKPHPESEGVGPGMMQMEVPDHLVVPSRDIVLNIRLSMKEVKTVLPLDPETGKILCVTCHNPHERGLMRERADTGADTFVRLRTPGLDICQYCHRK